MSNRKQQAPLYNPWQYTGESIQLLGQTVVAVMEVNGYVCARQIEKAETATRESSRQLKSLLKSTAETSAVLAQWSGVFQVKMQNFTAMGHEWRKVTLDAMREANDLLESSLSSLSSLPAYGAISNNQSGKTREAAQESTQKSVGKAAETPSGERRFTATMIAFPERRAAAMPKHSAAATHGTARTRRSA